jgi:hypothetical protein
VHAARMFGQARSDEVVVHGNRIFALLSIHVAKASRPSDCSPGKRSSVSGSHTNHPKP